MRDPHINLNLNLNLMECIQDMYNLIILSSIKWFKTNSAQPFLSDGFCLNCKRWLVHKANMGYFIIKETVCTGSSIVITLGTTWRT